MNKNVTVNTEIFSSDPEISAELSEKWESLTITDRFIFAKVMQQKEICLTLLQRLFPELDITDVKYVEAEKTVEGSIGSRGVRFDVYVKTPEKYAFTLEMQMEVRDSLPKRSRYYSAMICEDLLSAGVPYAALPPAYVVMFCPFDLFKKGLHRYSFRYTCGEDPAVLLEDGSFVVFLNSRGTVHDVSPEVLSFLNYMEGIVTEGDPFIASLDNAVKKAKKNANWRREYMLYEMEIAQERWAARKEGREAGIKEGREEGIKEGREAGIKEVMIRMITAKVKKGVELPVIADQLEEEESRIRPIYDLILARPEASPEEILQALSGPAAEE